MIRGTVRKHKQQKVQKRTLRLSIIKRACIFWISKNVRLLFRYGDGNLKT